MSISDWKPVSCGVFCLALALAICAGCKQAPEPSLTPEAGLSEETLEEIWEVVFLKGERVGHVHTSIFREPGPNGERLRIEHEEALTLRRGTDRIETRSTTTSWETPDGGLLEFTSVLAQGEIPMETTGRVAGNELYLEVGTTGTKTKVNLPWSEEFGGLYRVPASLKSQPLAPGETRVFRYLDVATNQLATRTLTAADFEHTSLTQDSKRLLRVESQTSIAGSTINSIMWLGEDGEIYKEQIPEMFNYTAIRATKEEALQKVAQLDIDLGRLSAVQVARPLSSPHDTKRITYRIHLESADPAQLFASGLAQQVVSEDEHTARLTVYAVRPDSRNGNPQAESEGTTRGDLEPNTLIQSDDPTVIDLAGQAAGQIADPWEGAVALEKWVNAHMTSRGMSSAFATAAEVARDLSGDCTEHAVLLTAMARARGIPARVAIGLVYYRQEFLYHMWTEVYIEDKWIPLDATLARGGIGGAHLKIKSTNLQGVSPNAAFLPVMEVMGQLDVEILDVE